jgi:hypothetical protein
VRRSEEEREERGGRVNVHLVVHQQHLELLLVVDNESLETIGADVPGPPVVTISDPHEGTVSL